MLEELPKWLRTSTAKGPAAPPVPSPLGIPRPQCSLTGAHLPSGSNEHTLCRDATAWQPLLTAQGHVVSIKCHQPSNL